jgi:Peptidase M1 N-terminal domain
LNTSNLELGVAKLYSDALKTEQEQSSCTFDSETERATFAFPTKLPAGSKAQLQVGFHGKLTGSLVGYYKSLWEHEGKTKYYALTQFEVDPTNLHATSVSNSLQPAHCCEARVSLLGRARNQGNLCHYPHLKSQHSQSEQYVGYL